jgi:hypothetical protein
VQDKRIPVQIKDVAGLVPGAYQVCLAALPGPPSVPLCVGIAPHSTAPQGRGKGNKFLDDLNDAGTDVLVGRLMLGNA